MSAGSARARAQRPIGRLACGAYIYPRQSVMTPRNVTMRRGLEARVYGNVLRADPLGETLVDLHESTESNPVYSRSAGAVLRRTMPGREPRSRPGRPKLYCNIANWKGRVKTPVEAARPRTPLPNYPALRASIALAPSNPKHPLHLIAPHRMPEDDACEASGDDLFDDDGEMHDDDESSEESSSDVDMLSDDDDILDLELSAEDEFDM